MFFKHLKENKTQKLIVVILELEEYFCFLLDAFFQMPVVFIYIFFYYRKEKQVSPPLRPAYK